MKMRMILASSAVAALAVLSLASPAQAATSQSDQAAALVTTVQNSADPSAALSKLSASDRDLVTKYLSVGAQQVTSTTVTPDAASRGATAAAAAPYCSTYTQRGNIINGLGGVIGNYWTTGRTCRSRTAVTSASYQAGGGQTNSPGWSYISSTGSSGVVRGRGVVSGQHFFRSQVGAWVIQNPSFCARTLQTLGADSGDTGICGVS